MLAAQSSILNLKIPLLWPPSLFARNFIYKTIYLKSPLALFPLKLTALVLSDPNLKPFLTLGLIEKLVYRFIVNLKPFSVALGAIKNLNTLLPSYVSNSITHSIVLNTIVNLKSPIKDVGISI